MPTMIGLDWDRLLGLATPTPDCYTATTQSPPGPAGASAMPKKREAEWNQALSAYLAEIDSLNTESARSVRFAMLLQQLLGVEAAFIDDYASGIERYIKVKHKDRVLRGAVDNLFGNVVIEFEVNLQTKLSEADEQLRRYVAILWSQEAVDHRTPFLCIATDGLRFVTYSPIARDPKGKELGPDDVRLQVLDKTDWSELDAVEVFYWLDRYFVRREVLHPTSEYVVRDFGARSHAFQSAATALASIWEGVKTRPQFSVIFENWDKYLRVVYGSKVAGGELFVRHTYLATLAKLMAWTRISGSGRLPDPDQIKELLEGRLFKALGIENFIEEDFFSWLSREDTFAVGIKLVRWLFSLLQNYRLVELSEDVLKSLYQELVDPETRHDLGEFYTPDWLAERMVDKLLSRKPKGSVLDPACGSGTFLYLTIKKKRERLGDSPETLDHVLASVYGIDIHPLAVIVSKTNYLLALGELLKRRRPGVITIPVYQADAIRLPEKEVRSTFWMQLPSYRVELDGREVFLPEPLLADIGQSDQAIELCKDFALRNRKKRIDEPGFQGFLKVQGFAGAEDRALVNALFGVTTVLKAFLEDDRDTIWSFLLKNIYKPLFLKRKFDFVVGNPPWISLRYLEPAYQAFLKLQIQKRYKLLRGRVEQVPNFEVGTLFLVRIADLYLTAHGRIAFVLPRSVFTADQHDGLRQRRFQFSEHPSETLFWEELWDLEKVKPLFNVPASVVIAGKDGAKQEYPIAGEIISGELERKNASASEAKASLDVEKVKWSLQTRGLRSYWTVGDEGSDEHASYYKRAFTRGVNALLPHSFWLVEIKPSAVGFNPDLPPVQSAERAVREGKAAFKNLSLRGTVERRFLYLTLLSTDLVPFSHRGFRLAVVPAEELPDGKLSIIEASDAQARGYVHLAQWLEKVEREWSARRGAKAKRMTAYQYLDLFGGVSRQRTRAGSWVIYNKSGTFLAASVIHEKDYAVEVQGQLLKLGGFIVDQTLYYYEAETPQEACYLAAILNSTVVDKAIKPMQSRGLFGPRDIHKKPLELPIPRYDPDNAEHRELAALGEKCRIEVAKWIGTASAKKVKSIGKLRNTVRELLAAHLKEVDRLSARLFSRPLDEGASRRLGLVNRPRS